MGVALFAARKIALLNSINNLEMMRMQISSQQQSLTDRVMNISMQQMNLQTQANMFAGSGGGNKWGSIGQAAAGLGGSLGSILGGKTNGSEFGQYGAMAGSAIGLIGSLFSKGGGGADPTQQLQQQNMQMEQQRMQLIQQEKRLEMVAKQLETQLAMKNKELEGVEEGEKKAIDRSGPKFS